ncbi:MAG TPA: DNA gyrase inhibitor YacG [Steroidobacteraceae bacterium]|nr:DNA gyrase inhibitor YacG [Steroidobacteraceae bacterium]
MDWATTPSRPFCSERCRLIDLGAWFSGGHAIAGDPVAQDGDADPGNDSDSQ